MAAGRKFRELHVSLGLDTGNRELTGQLVQSGINRSPVDVRVVRLMSAVSMERAYHRERLLYASVCSRYMAEPTYRKTLLGTSRAALHQLTQRGVRYLTY
jgi:hypothetical protein